jgi:hypothetical protein
MFHEGEFEGRKVRLPVFLGRRPDEPVNHELRDFYEKLLTFVDRSVFREGEWRLCDRTGWPDNSSFENLIFWSWLKDDARYLIGVNLSDTPAQALVQVGWKEVGSGTWQLTDVLSGAIYERNGSEMVSTGLYVELGPWSSHFFQCIRTN